MSLINSLDVVLRKGNQTLKIFAICRIYSFENEWENDWLIDVKHCRYV